MSPDKVTVDVQVLAVICSERLHGYLRTLVEMEGFGDSPGEVAERFIWDRVNDLIASGRLTLDRPPAPSSGPR